MILHWKKHKKAEEHGANFSYHVVLLDESENEAKGQLISEKSLTSAHFSKIMFASKN